MSDGLFFFIVGGSGYVFAAISIMQNRRILNDYRDAIFRFVDHIEKKGK